MPIPHVACPDAGPAPYVGALKDAPVDCRLTVTAWALPPETAVRRARSLLRSQLTDRITDQSVFDDLEIMVSELATNAVVHADGPYEMRILQHAGVPVACEIVDTGRGLDEIAEHLGRHADPDDPAPPLDLDALQPSGRGLGVVAHLSGGRCGAHTTRLHSTGRPGKGVWFNIPLPT